MSYGCSALNNRLDNNHRSGNKSLKKFKTNDFIDLAVNNVNLSSATKWSDDYNPNLVTMTLPFTINSGANNNDLGYLSDGKIEVIFKEKDSTRNLKLEPNEEIIGIEIKSECGPTLTYEENYNSLQDQYLYGDNYDARHLKEDELTKLKTDVRKLVEKVGPDVKQLP